MFNPLPVVVPVFQKGVSIPVPFAHVLFSYRPYSICKAQNFLLEEQQITVFSLMLLQRVQVFFPGVHVCAQVLYCIYLLMWLTRLLTEVR